LTSLNAPVEVWARPDVPVDPASVEVEQVWYPSKDGTRISMFLVHRKGLAKTGRTPTILSGYGGFNISETPLFVPTLFQWLEDGGLFALPNLRGGGEYGDAWHEAGMLDQKQNTFDDFIAAAEWLRPTATRTRRTWRFAGFERKPVHRRRSRSALSCSGSRWWRCRSDMLPGFLMARYWVPIRLSENASQFAFLHAYSPYHHVKAGTIPAVAHRASMIHASTRCTQERWPPGRRRAPDPIRPIGPSCSGWTAMPVMARASRSISASEMWQTGGFSSCGRWGCWSRSV
jgi:hypothetical protein